MGRMNNAYRMKNNFVIMHKVFVFCFLLVICAAPRYPSPKARREFWVNVLAKFVHLRVEGSEESRRNPRVFGRVTARSAAVQHNAIQFVLKIQGGLTFVGKVNCQRNPLAREREHPWRWVIAKGFEDVEEGRRQAGGSYFFQNLLNGAVVVIVRNNALVLHKAALAVAAIPLQDGVQRVEERFIVRQTMFDFGGLLATGAGFLQRGAQRCCRA